MHEDTSKCHTSIALLNGSGVIIKFSTNDFYGLDPGMIMCTVCNC